MKVSRNFFVGYTTILGLLVLFSYYLSFVILMDSDTRVDAWVGIKGIERNINYTSWFFAVCSYVHYFYYHFKHFNEYKYYEKNRLIVLYTGILICSALWGPYTAIFINIKNGKEKKEGNEVFNRYSIVGILIGVTLFSSLHLNFFNKIEKKYIKKFIINNKISNTFFKYYFLFHVGVFDNILWTRKFLKIYKD